MSNLYKKQYNNKKQTAIESKLKSKHGVNTSTIKWKKTTNPMSNKNKEIKNFVLQGKQKTREKKEKDGKVDKNSYSVLKNLRKNNKNKINVPIKRK